MEEKTAVNTTSSAATETIVASTVTETDAEARIAALEAEKARLIEESANYKLGMLKAKGKVKPENLDEDAEEKMRRIAHETLAESRLVAIAQEQDGIIQKALKENKELKLALSSKTTTAPASMGTHSEGLRVMDTTITPDQQAAFKSRGWTDKDIERYKKNLQKNTR